MNKACILGAGSWGTAQAVLLSNNYKMVSLWGRPEDGIAAIRQNSENRQYLPGIKIPPNLEPTDQLGEALNNAELVVLAVPSQAVRAVTQIMAPYLQENVFLVNTAKGLEISTGMRLSQVVKDVLGEEIMSKYAVLSGPSHAEEVARRVPTAVTVAAHKKDTAFYVQDAFMTSFFRVYTNPDVAGVELGGALKNVVALATGIAHGLEYGDNTKAALITRGLAEITRMGEVMGGNPRTFAGLSGMGDLVVTCASKYSRNRKAGELIGQGFSLNETLNQIGMVVESAHTVKVVHQLAREIKVDMPISKACYRILYEKTPPRPEVEALMTRSKKHEIEEIANHLKGW